MSEIAWIEYHKRRVLTLIAPCPPGSHVIGVLIQISARTRFDWTVLMNHIHLFERKWFNSRNNCVQEFHGMLGIFALFENPVVNCIRRLRCAILADLEKS